jgi:hypothetical protein
MVLAFFMFSRAANAQQANQAVRITSPDKKLLVVIKETKYYRHF